MIIDQREIEIEFIGKTERRVLIIQKISERPMTKIKNIYLLEFNPLIFIYNIVIFSDKE